MLKQREARRSFIAKLPLTPVLALIPHGLRSGTRAQDDGTEGKALKCAEEMRPGEILEALGRNSFAFVPVSPMLEWHSLA